MYCLLRRQGLREVRYFHSVREYSRNILKTFSQRGLLQDIFPKEKVSDLVALLEKAPRGVYAGFDPTADSLHIGNLVVIMALLHAQRSGHTPIALLGGATGRIGDPSGKSVERPALDSSALQHNILGLKSDLVKIFENHRKYMWSERDRELRELVVVNNEDWYSQINIIDFLSNIGRHFRLGPMLGRHAVKSRLESEEGLSLTEFTYQTFQAYDWLKLYQDAGCLVQVGGSDQMGNIVAGQELISRALDAPVFGLTIPLVLSETGDKFGKTAGTPVWLNQSRTSPYQLYQYMMRRPDSELDRLLKLFTFLPLGEIEKTLRKHETRPESRYAQQKLAENITLLLHGEQGLLLAQRSTRILYNQDIKELAKLTQEETRDLFQQADYIVKLYQPGITMIDFAVSIGCFKSDRDALRIIAAGGFYVNHTQVKNPEEVLMHGTHILDNNITLTRVGKKNYYIVEWT